MKLLTVLILGYILWRLVRKYPSGIKAPLNSPSHPTFPAKNNSLIEDAQYRDIDAPKT
jgi:hypothetical protein